MYRELCKWVKIMKFMNNHMKSLCCNKNPRLEIRRILSSLANYLAYSPLVFLICKMGTYRKTQTKWP